MSDTTTVPTPADVAPKATEGEQPEQDGKTFDAEYVERLRKEAAKYRTEAKANADAAKRLAEIEEANKTAEQKAAERLAEAERKAVEIEARATRAEVAASTGIPVDILAGPKDSTAEAVTEYAEMVKAHLERTASASGPRAPKPDANQGRTGDRPPTTGELFAATFEGRI